MDYVERYIEMQRVKGNRFALLNGVLFIRRDRWIVPVGPVAQDFYVNKSQCRQLLHKLGGLWVMWTDGFELSSQCSDWYTVICRQHIPIETITNGKRRSELRRALRESEVRMVDAEEIARNGYETYSAVMTNRYPFATLIKESEFRRRVRVDSLFNDLRHHWGAYCDGKMVAFAQNLIYDTVEVNYSMINLHPEYLNRYCGYHLIYKMNEYYLAEKNFQYVNDGFRSIGHETGIQDFLINKFGFEKAYTGLHVHYQPLFGQILRFSHPFRAIATQLFPKVQGLFEMDRLRMPNNK